LSSGGIRGFREFPENPSEIKIFLYGQNFVNQALGVEAKRFLSLPGMLCMRRRICYNRFTNQQNNLASAAAGR